MEVAVLLLNEEQKVFREIVEEYEELEDNTGVLSAYSKIPYALREDNQYGNGDIDNMAKELSKIV